MDEGATWDGHPSGTTLADADLQVLQYGPADARWLESNLLHQHCLRWVILNNASQPALSQQTSSDQSGRGRLNTRIWARASNALMLAVQSNLGMLPEHCFKWQMLAAAVAVHI